MPKLTGQKISPLLQFKARLMRETPNTCISRELFSDFSQASLGWGPGCCHRLALADHIRSQYRSEAAESSHSGRPAFEEASPVFPYELVGRMAASSGGKIADTYLWAF